MHVLEVGKIGSEGPLEGTVQAIRWAFIAMYTKVLMHSHLNKRGQIVTKILSAGHYEFSHDLLHQIFIAPSSAGVVKALVSEVAM